ncbi:MAG: anthranilate synthase component I family protein [Candidatus Omnitrophica bacterium]|nr:anthranilate synthase component I family protein [Candidatus Omnitrophota bacterium]
MITPSRRAFKEFARLGKWVPLAMRLPLAATPEAIFQSQKEEGPRILLESARLHPTTGRYSFISGRPTSLLIWERGGLENPLELFQRILDSKRALRLPGFPPFVGGAMGFFGYDLYRHIEKIPQCAFDDLRLPEMGLLFSDEATVVDHLSKELWLIVLANSFGNLDAEYDRSRRRLEEMAQQVRNFPAALEPDPAPAEPPDRLEATHTRFSFEAMVRRAKGYIAEGQIYQANLSQRFSFPLREDPWLLYRRLRAINPSPFAAFADFGGFQVVCGSPERFLRVRGQGVETRPIAGTRPRGKTAAETDRLRQDLILNEKERAEHLMLVDLERNDLGRVCRWGSVEVDEFMVLEEYSHVIHIVSNVRGILKPRTRFIDLIASAFPGGTITGCPKIRSIEIIDELEPVRRQLYTGSLGYVSYTGDADLNLLIRSACVSEGKVHVQTGAGIVADSDPGKEFEETLHKAQALLEALHADQSETGESAPLPAAALAF